MKALLIGCGNQRGEIIIDACKKNGYQVTNIGSTESSLCKNIKVSWQDLDLITLHKLLRKVDGTIDFIFFNHNATTLGPNDFTSNTKTLDLWKTTKNWTHSYWLSCQLPYVLIKTLETKLNNQSLIGWMLSGYIDKNKEGVYNHPDYSGYKYTNYMLMKSFKNIYFTFGINPDFADLGTIFDKVFKKEISSGDFI